MYVRKILTKGKEREEKEREGSGIGSQCQAPIKRISQPTAMRLIQSSYNLFSPTLRYLGLPALVFICLLVNISYLKYIVSQSSQWYLQDSRALQMFYVLQPYLHWPLEMKYSYLKGVREEVIARLNESHGCWLRNLLNWGLTLWSYATPFPFLPFSFVNIFFTYIPFNRLNNSLFTLSLSRSSR